MTITKATELLRNLLFSTNPKLDYDNCQAIKLSIFALKRFQQARSYGLTGYFSKLPDED